MRLVLIRDTHGLFARVPSRGPLFFHVGSADSSHNTSKVTKAEGKQIRGRALTGLLNTRARPGGGPHRCWKWRRCGPADDQRMTAAAAASTPLGRLPESQACIPRPSHVRLSLRIPPRRKEVHYSLAYYTRDESDSSRRWEGTNEGRVKQLSGKPFSLLSSRAEPPALNSGNFMIFYFRLVLT